MRLGDHQTFYPKSERIYKDTYGFWVTLREGLLGPFITEGIAQANLNCFLDGVRDDLTAPLFARVAFNG